MQLSDTSDIVELDLSNDVDFKDFIEDSTIDSDKKSKGRNLHDYLKFKLEEKYPQRYTNFFKAFYFAEDSYDNTCAVRMSRALNYCGLAIPEIKGKTYKGGDNMNYFIKVIDIRDHLKKVFKNKPLKKVARKNELEVIFIESECGWNDASGHVDILANNEYGIGPHDNCKTVVGWINLDD